MSGGPRQGWRHALLLAALAAAPVAGPVAPAPAARAQERAAREVIVVSRERILRETQAGRALREAEQRLGAEFEARVDAAKRALEAEEAKLARLRATLPREEFEARASAFDQKVRAARRLSQRQAAELQQAIRTAREQLSGALAQILVDLLRETGASIVLDAEQILVAGPAVNHTDEVIRMFDERVAAPEIVPPEPEPLLPVAGTAPGAAGD